MLLLKVELNTPSCPLPNTLSHISNEGFVKRSFVAGLPLWHLNELSFAFLMHTKDSLLFVVVVGGGGGDPASV